MTPSTDVEAIAAPFKRYLPLVIWILVAATVILIPLKIIGYGFIPLDDATRHAAKAVSGKAWSDILVLRDGVIEDHNFGWHFILGGLHRVCGLDTDGLIVFSVCSLMMFFLASFLPWIRRPESFLIGCTLGFVALGGNIARIAFGRPYIFAMGVLVLLLGLWTRKPPGRPSLRLAIGTSALFAAAAFIHGSWYLFLLPIGAFVLSGRIADAIALGLCFAVGVFTGSCLTGSPIDFIVGHIGVVLSSLNSSVPSMLLVTEFHPSDGNPAFMLLVLAAVAYRNARGEPLSEIVRHPAFVLGVLGWVLGLKILRFWTDWGYPAFLFWIVTGIDRRLQEGMGTEDLARLVTTLIAATGMWFSITTDRGGRWTGNLRIEFLEADNPALDGWLPEPGGIVYSHWMDTFYRTFYKNPHADWRYILGFEPTFMPEEDHQTFRSIQWNNSDPRAFEPWISKMTQADRLVFPSGSGSPPDIPELEWYYGATDTWIGRLPRTPDASIPPESGIQPRTSRIPESPTGRRRLSVVRMQEFVIRENSRTKRG